MKSDNKKILKIKTVTLRYIEFEDRMRMAAHLDGHGQMVFWLTLRHCQHIVPALVKCLENKHGDETPTDRSLALSCRQHVAEWKQRKKPPAEPVLPSGEEHSLLPRQVTVTCGEKSVALLFPLEDGKSAQLLMNFQELRQWLGILHRQFRRAGWPLDAWPKWFTGNPHGMN